MSNETLKDALVRVTLKLVTMKIIVSQFKR